MPSFNADNVGRQPEFKNIFLNGVLKARAT
jgi:hypothetical protein